MEEGAGEEGSSQAMPVRAHHIKKRALKNKAISVSFDEKDLNDYVTGFHKRKKKRRKEALQQKEEAERRKRIEQRKKRKLERDSVYGALPDSGADAAGSDEDYEDDEETEPVACVSGMQMYDNGDMQVTVTTSEIAVEEEYPSTKLEPGRPLSVEGVENTKHKIPVIKKKPIQRNLKKRSRAKPQSKRDKRKGKKKKQKQH